MDIVSILQVGVIGLGFLLAYLSYKLLDGERRQKVPRNKMFIPIYIFMFFSLCIVIIGGVFKSLPYYIEHLKMADKQCEDEINLVNGQLQESEANYELLDKNCKEKIEKVQGLLNDSQTKIQSIIASKCKPGQCVKANGECGQVRIFSEIFYAENPNKGKGAGLRINTISTEGVMVVGSGQTSLGYNGRPRLSVRGKWVCE